MSIDRRAFIKGICMAAVFPGLCSLAKSMEESKKLPLPLTSKHYTRVVVDDPYKGKVDEATMEAVNEYFDKLEIGV